MVFCPLLSQLCREEKECLIFLIEKAMQASEEFMIKDPVL
jgi:hypothetical protein